MAEIDVTDLLSDPDFCDSFTVTRRNSEVDDQGYLQMVSTELPNIIGSVQPASGRTLQLRPDLANVNGVIEIWSVFDFQTDTDRAKSDLIQWRGDTYICEGPVQNFQNFGAGYTRIVASLYKTIGDPG